MSRSHILIIDADFDTAELLRIFFEGQDYEVSVASCGEDALVMLHKMLPPPHLIILDAELPGMDGYEVCREVTHTTRTSHIPVIFLTRQAEHTDRIRAFELGADDYITKPFDIEDVSLRARNAITRAEREMIPQIHDPVPGLALIKEQLRLLQKTSKQWTYIDLKIREFEAFQDVYGKVASTEILRHTALILGEVIDELGTPEDFVGHVGINNFSVISYSDQARQLTERIIDHFDIEKLKHYVSTDRERQYIVLPNGEERPLMTIDAKSTNQFPIEGINLNI